MVGAFQVERFMWLRESKRERRTLRWAGSLTGGLVPIPGPRDHGLTRGRTLNWLSHLGAPTARTYNHHAGIPPCYNTFHCHKLYHLANPRCAENLESILLFQAGKGKGVGSGYWMNHPTVSATDKKPSVPSEKTISLQWALLSCSCSCGLRS